MKMCVMPHSEASFVSARDAAIAYAEKNGFTWEPDNFCVRGDAGDVVVLIYYHGSKFFGVLCTDDFTCPGLCDCIGYMELMDVNEAEALRILKARSGIDISMEKSHHYYLHDGAIDIRLSDGIMNVSWYGGGETGYDTTEVTKHVASILGLLKGAFGNK